jgi:hypothetical protein
MSTDLTHVSLELACEERKDPSTDCTATNFDVLMLEAPTEDAKRSWIEHWPDGNLCCTQEMADSGKCPMPQVNSLIVPTTIANAFKRSLQVETDEIFHLDQMTEAFHLDIKDTGLYVVIMAICKEDSTPVRMLGTIESMNPYGYLPADQFPDIPFYGVLTCCYTLLGVVWLVVLTIHSGELIFLQLLITFIIVLGMIESTLLFSHYMSWNDNGSMDLSITVSGVIFGVMKRALSRVVVLMVSMGYGVVRSNLGDDMKKIVYMGCSYFVLSLIYTLTITMPSNARFVADIEFENMLALVVLMLAAVDTTFYMWIIRSLNNLITALETRRQVEKCALYQNFRLVLFLSLSFSIIWAVYSSMLLSGNNYENSWQSRWSMDALWESLYFIVFVSICFLWAPARNSQRFAYSALDLSETSGFIKGAEGGADGSSDEEEEGDNADESLRNATMARLDAEYGSSFRDDDNDPFAFTSGALDPDMAIIKKA